MLTNEEVRLPALAGMADEYLLQQDLGSCQCGTHHAGLWFATTITTSCGKAPCVPLHPAHRILGHFGRGCLRKVAPNTATTLQPKAQLSWILIETLPLHPGVPHGAVKEGHGSWLRCGAEQVARNDVSIVWEHFMTSEERHNKAHWVGLSWKR